MANRAASLGDHQKPWWQHLLTMPFVEAAVSAILGAIIAAIARTWSSALITFAIGLILGFSRFAFTQTLRRKLSPLTRLCQLVDVNRQVSYPRFLELVNLYSQIVERDFRRVKDAVVEEAVDHLRQLAQQKRSRELPTSDYYNWLLSMLDAQSSGGEIWAVSTMNPFEWVDSAAERKFADKNKAAVARGATLTRVFIVEQDKVEALRQNRGVSWHFTEPGKIFPYIAMKEDIVRTDPKLLKDLGDGFIAFDRRVAMIDVFLADGSARGYVTMNELDIETLRARFEALTNTYGELHGKQAGP